jgi:glycosyltransferase involved in cell wall biosynthesis
VTPAAVAPPGVSVILVVRDGAAYLAEALDSICRQSHTRFEVLVVDGHSRDATVCVAQSFPGVRVVSQQGGGLANARNQGLALAIHPYVAFLDHDDRWLPSKLTLQVAVLEQQPRLDYCLCHLRFISAQGVPIAPPANRAGAARSFPAVTPGGLVARRSLFERVGGFDPAYAIGCDAAWFALARDAGIPSTLLEDVLLEKRLHGTNLSNRSAINRSEMFRIAAASVARRRLPPTTTPKPPPPPGHGGS